MTRKGVSAKTKARLNREAEELDKTYNPEPVQSPQPEIFESPESSTIAGAMYYPLDNSMDVVFKDRKNPDVGRMYHYVGPIPKDLWDNFKNAESKGKFFDKMIKPIFEGVQVNT